jgi:hypothetical protein
MKAVTSLLSLFVFLLPAHPMFADEATEIIEQAIAAHGGKENLERALCRHSKENVVLTTDGKIGAFAKVECWSQYPDKKRVETTLIGDDKAQIRVINGEQGWCRSEGSEGEMTKDEVHEFRQGLERMRIWSLVSLLNSREYTLSFVGELKESNRESVGVLVRSQHHPDVTLFFDKTTHLMHMSSVTYCVGGEQKTIEERYHLYREADGVKYAAYITASLNGKKWTDTTVTELEFPKNITPDVFQKP